MITEPTDLWQEYSDKYEEPAHHIAALLGASIVTLDIRARLLFPLWDSGIRTVGQLLEQYKKGLSSIRNIGDVAYAELEKIMRVAGLIED